MLKAVLQLTTVPVVLLSSLLLTACDSGTDEANRASSSSSSSVAPVTPTLEIPNVHVQFPPPVSTTQDNVITVRGAVTDPADVSAVLVQGVAVTSDDGLRNWTADVPLAAGNNIIGVTPLNAAGEALAPIELQVTRAAQMASPLAMVFDSTSDRLLVLDTVYDAVLEVSRASGARSWFEPETAAQSLLTDPRGIALDSGNNRLLVHQHDDDAAIVAIDLTSREQALAALARPEDRLMTYPKGISVDNGTAYVAVNETVFFDADGKSTSDLGSAITQRTAGMIYSSAFGAEEATILSNQVTPSEELPLLSVVDLAGDETSDLLYVLDRGVKVNEKKQRIPVYTIKSVSKTTGARQLVFPVTLPTDPSFEEEPVEEDPSVEETGADPNATAGEPPASDSSNEGPFELVAPRKIALDSVNNRLWILDGNRFAYLDLASGKVTVAASNDVPEDAQHSLRAASALAVDNINARIYGADNGYDRILSIDPSSGKREILSSSQTGASGSEEALMLAPGHLSLDPYNERLFISDRLRANVLVLDMTSGERTALLPEPVAGQSRALQYPLASAYDAATGSLYVFDNFNQWPRLPTELRSANAPRLVEINVETRSTAITGFSGAARFADIALDEVSRELFSAQTSGDRFNSFGIFRLEPDAEGGAALMGLVSGGSFPNVHNVLRDPRALTVDRARERLLIADAAVNGVLTVDLQSGIREILGDLEQEDAPDLNAPRAIKLDNSGERALVLDSANDAIVAVDLETGDRSWASQNASNGRILLFNPQDMVLHPVFNYAVVSDDYSDTVIAIDLVTQERVILAR